MLATVMNKEHGIYLRPDDHLKNLELEFFYQPFVSQIVQVADFKDLVFEKRNS